MRYPASCFVGVGRTIGTELAEVPVASRRSHERRLLHASQRPISPGKKPSPPLPFWQAWRRHQMQPSLHDVPRSLRLEPERRVPAARLSPPQKFLSSPSPFREIVNLTGKTAKCI